MARGRRASCGTCTLCFEEYLLIASPSFSHPHSVYAFAEFPLKMAIFGPWHLRRRGCKSTTGEFKATNPPACLGVPSQAGTPLHLSVVGSSSAAASRGPTRAAVSNGFFLLLEVQNKWGKMAKMGQKGSFGVKNCFSFCKIASSLGNFFSSNFSPFSV